LPVPSDITARPDHELVHVTVVDESARRGYTAEQQEGGVIGDAVAVAVDQVVVGITHAKAVAQLLPCIRLDKRVAVDSNGSGPGKTERQRCQLPIARVTREGAAGVQFQVLVQLEAAKRGELKTILRQLQIIVRREVVKV